MEYTEHTFFEDEGRNYDNVRYVSKQLGFSSMIFP